jgi:hypothetical protein
MGRIFGLLLGVLGIWAMTEVYLHGTAGAFGGAFAQLSGEASAGDAADGRSLGRRAGDSVESAQAEAEARRERMLGE